ncbi:hypothetical protein IMG5_093270, partial [Ichthyophthirius multifiliis]
SPQIKQTQFQKSSLLISEQFSFDQNISSIEKPSLAATQLIKLTNQCIKYSVLSGNQYIFLMKSCQSYFSDSFLIFNLLFIAFQIINLVGIYHFLRIQLGVLLFFYTLCIILSKILKENLGCSYMYFSISSSFLKLYFQLHFVIPIGDKRNNYSIVSLFFQKQLNAIYPPKE